MKRIKPVSRNKPYYWMASEMMENLGYKTWKSFTHLIHEASKMMIFIDIPYYENVLPIAKDKKGHTDFYLSRFACFLVVMLADYRKKKVAETQRKFIIKAEKYGVYLKDISEINRLKIREELSVFNKWLNSIASKAEVMNYSDFNRVGYAGMYGMNELSTPKKLSKEVTNLDYMGHMELAANLFRIVLTEQRVRSKQVKGQKNLEKAHYEVSKSIRNLILTHTGNAPENLPIYRGLSKLKMQLKEGYQKMIEREDK